jgi:hypothetical protein
MALAGGLPGCVSGMVKPQDLSKCTNDQLVQSTPLKSFDVWQIELKEGFPGVRILKFYGKNHYLVLGRHEELKPGPHGDLYFECDSQGQSGYDVIDSVITGPASMEILLRNHDPEQGVDTEHFGPRTQYHLSMKVPDVKWTKIKELLHHLLRDFRTEVQEGGYHAFQLQAEAGQ